jgi:hypothetical protein
MKLDCQLAVNASKESIWSVLTDYDHMVDNISAITKVEIHNRPTSEIKKDDITGLKWTETRTMFGQEATETVWVTDCVPLEYYQTRAENHGAVYISKMYIEEKAGDDEDGKIMQNNNYVGMSFDGEAESLCSKIMMVAMGWMFVGETKKALMKDLEDIKAKAESM